MTSLRALGPSAIVTLLAIHQPSCGGDIRPDLGIEPSTGTSTGTTQGTNGSSSSTGEGPSNSTTGSDDLSTGFRLDVDPPSEYSTCGCGEAETFIQLDEAPAGVADELGVGGGGAGGTSGQLLFDQAPSFEHLHEAGCDGFDTPVFKAGGSCLPTEAAACNSEGACVRFGSKGFFWWGADGELRWRAPFVYKSDESYWGQGDDLRAEVGTFRYVGDDGQIVSGSYSLCTVFWDECLR